MLFSYDTEINSNSFIGRIYLIEFSTDLKAQQFSSLQREECHSFLLNTQKETSLYSDCTYNEPKPAHKDKIWEAIFKMGLAEIQCS
jgi:hypothetical protein